jgi:hypothetical protein
MTSGSALSGTLKLLLGPSEPEIDCDECFERLDRYVELESAGEPADAILPGFRAHLAGCPACAEEHASLLELIERDPPS